MKKGFWPRVPHVGLGGGPHLGAVRGGTPSRPRSRGSTSGPCSTGPGRWTPAPALPTPPGTRPPSWPRPGTTPGEGRGPTAPWWCFPTRTVSSCLSRTCSSWSWNPWGRKRTAKGNDGSPGDSPSTGTRGPPTSTPTSSSCAKVPDDFFATFVDVLPRPRLSRPHQRWRTGATSGDFLLGFLLGTRIARWPRPAAVHLSITLPDVSPRSAGHAHRSCTSVPVGLYAAA